MKPIGFRQDITPALPLYEIPASSVTQRLLDALPDDTVIVCGIRKWEFDWFQGYCPETEELQIVETIGDITQQFLAGIRTRPFYEQHWYTAKRDDCIRASGHSAAA